MVRRTEVLQGLRLMTFLSVLDRVEAAELSKREAAGILGVSERTFRRWCGRSREEGEAGLCDRRLARPRRSGKRSTHVLPKPDNLTCCLHTGAGP
jgi:transposase